jgi:hypothetical protein
MYHDEATSCVDIVWYGESVGLIMEVRGPEGRTQLIAGFEDRTFLAVR